MAIHFCSGKVLNMTATAGWDGAESYISTKIVDDPRTSSYFSPPTRGEPKRFQISGFTFDGLIQKVNKNTDAQGGIYYEVQSVAPSELLAGAVVVLAGDATNIQMPNLINAYGYYESASFGSANTNDTGMLWGHFASAVSSITASGNNPLQWKGHTYSINIDKITTGINPPANYRIRGEFTNMTDILNQVCQDAGFNYLVRLNMGPDTHHEIDFVLADRTTQPSLDFIEPFASSLGNTLIKKSVGTEFRNEYTSAILVGGDVHELRAVEDTAGLGNRIWPFWGSDVNGNIIIGNGFDDDHTADLNASPIADLIGFLGGGFSYTCTVREMRCALDSYDSWANFMNIWRPAVATALNISCTWHTDYMPVAGVAAEYIQDSQSQLENWSDQMTNNDYVTKGQRLYEFVRSYAAEYYGKKFLVRIPDYVQYRLVPDTLSSFEFSFEPTDSAFLPDGSTPLGLNYYNELFFQDQAGKTTCFVRVDDAATIDLSVVPPEGSVVQTGVVSSLYLQARPFDFFTPVTFPDTFTTDTCAIIDLGSPVLQKPSDPYGGISNLAYILAGPGATSGDIVAANNLLLDGLNYSTAPPIRLAPAAFKPDAAAIPMKSNRIKYGPWVFSGATPGKPYYEQDDSLTPWEYGDFGALQAAATAKLQNIISDQQESEVGDVQHVGMPLFSLGDVIGSGGPNINQITVDFSTGGITTSYQVETYSHRLYKFYNERANQIKRMGMAFQQIRRAQRIQFFAQRERYFAQMQHSFGVNHRYSEAFRQHSPHHVLVAHTVPDSSRYTHTSVSMQKYRDSIINGRIRNVNAFKNTAVVGMESIFRPYATYPSSNLPQMRLSGVASSIMATSLNPWQSGNDIEWVTRGTGEYQRLCTLHATSLSWNNVRAIGLKGPLIMVGWGYDFYNGRPWPNTGTQPGGNIQTMATSFPPNYLRTPSSMMAAPIDLRYDSIRNVWASPGACLVGTTSGTISGGSSGTFTLLGTTHTLTVWNHFTATISGSKKGICSYYPINNRWYLTSVEC